ncbi:hypothetical protein [Demequina maris]|uniref:hypothetical protein n=1 Tax=Demequina maris TaxID=1638982 RepID=UPI000782BDBB|nr:hypothetical protein [Demequina maris]
MSGPSRVEVLVEPGLYQVSSSISATRYFIDSRLGGPVRYLRVPGAGSTPMRLDHGWRPLALLVCLPPSRTADAPAPAGEVDVHTSQQWVLAVGAEHVFHTPDPRVPPGWPGTYWVQSSPCREIRILETLPQVPRERLTTDHREQAP